MAKNIEDIEGIGPIVAEKLREKGYSTIESIAISTAKELSNSLNIPDDTCDKIIKDARTKIDVNFQTAEAMLEKRKEIGRISTGSERLDSLIGGGVETRAITEVFGEFASGKSQIAHQLAVNVQLDEKKGGIEAECIYIDTESTFRPERVIEMSTALDLDSKEVLNKIYVAKAMNSSQQMIILQECQKMLSDGKIKLIILDSLTSQFRADYVGRENLAERQQKLNEHIHLLQRLADIYNVATFVTNQVLSAPDVFFGDPTKPVGGHILAHQVTTRLYLRKSKGPRRICRLVDSPYLPEGEVVFEINEKGIRD